MKNKKIKITFSELEKQTKKLAEKIPNNKYTAVFGIPAGGLVPAFIISQKLNIPLLSLEEYNQHQKKKDILVVDDLIDSGKTLLKYLESNKAVVYYKEHSNLNLVDYYQKEMPTVWLDFPHEKSETGIEEHITRVIEYIGEDTDRQGLKETPKRVIKSYEKLFEGYNKEIKFTVFDNESNIDQIVGLSNIEFFSTCEHHLLPFFGKAHVYYIPDKKIVGISKLARVVDLYARRLQNQERIAKQVADYIEKRLKPKAIAVILEGQHLCMVARGVEKKNAIMKTSELRGAFLENGTARQELFNLIK